VGFNTEQDTDIPQSTAHSKKKYRNIPPPPIFSDICWHYPIFISKLFLILHNYISINNKRKCQLILAYLSSKEKFEFIGGNCKKYLVIIYAGISDKRPVIFPIYNSDIDINQSNIALHKLV